jgi:hypothetical protein
VKKNFKPQEWYDFHGRPNIQREKSSVAWTINATWKMAKLRQLAALWKDVRKPAGRKDLKEKIGEAHRKVVHLIKHNLKMAGQCLCK